MDSYHFSSLTNRPASEPIPDLNLPSLPDLNLPLTPADSDASPSGRSSGVPQPIDFGGSVTGYSSGASQSRRTSVPPIEYGNASQNGGATGRSASQRTSSRSQRTYTDEEKSKAISGLHQVLKDRSSIRNYSKKIGIPKATLYDWHLQGGGSTRSQRRYTDEEKSRAISGLQQALENKSSIRIYSKEIGIPESTLQIWCSQDRGSVERPRTYTDEEKSRAISGLQQALENKLSTRKYSKHIGIPRTTLRRWQLEVRGSLQSQRTDTDEGSSRSAR